MKILINGQEVETSEGTTILAAASAAGVRIPTLCYLRNTAPGGSCGVCEVEVDGTPMRACAAKVREGMGIRTDSAPLRARRRERLEQLAQAHRFDCEFCPRCTDCEFIRVLNEYGIYDYEYSRRPNIDSKEAFYGELILDASQCLGCRRCVFACPEKVISIQDSRAQIQKDGCTGCGMCLAACPTAAITVDETLKLRTIRRALHDGGKLCAAIVTPDAGAVFGEMIFDPAGQDASGKVAAILRHLGFDKVFGASRVQSVPALSDAVHRQYPSSVTVSISTNVGRERSGTDVDLTIYGLFTLYRRACVSRHTMVQVWRSEEAAAFDTIECAESAPAACGFGGAMPHRDCYTRNLSDLSALRAAALNEACGAREMDQRRTPI